MSGIRVRCAGRGSAALDRAVPTLSAEGFEVDVVPDGATALDALADVDCLVAAFDLPDMDGTELLSRVHAVDPSLPVILLSSVEAGEIGSTVVGAVVTGHFRWADGGSAALADQVRSAVAPAPAGDAQAGANYRALVEAMADGVYTVDLDGRFTMVNERTAGLSGYDREELLGEHVSKVMTEEGIERGDAAIRDLLSREDPYSESVTFEMDMVTKAGEHVPCEDHVALLTDGERATGSIGVVRDVSASKRRDERLRQLHEAARELVSATDARQVADVTVRALAEILEFPITSVRLVDETRSFLLPTAISEETLDTLGERPVYLVDGNTYPARVFRSDEPAVVDDVRSLSTDHDWGPIRSAFYLPLGEYGALSIGSTEPAAFDEEAQQLTEVLAATAETALARADQRAALTKERDQLAALFENVPDPAVMVEYQDGEPIVQEVNSAFTEVFGFEPPEIVDRSIDEFIVPPTAEREAEQYNDQIQADESFHGEVRRMTVNGPRDFLLHVAPQKVGMQTTRGFAIYTDITEQKERERELQRQNERLEQFASVVSHDLRNPLNILQGRLDLAQETGDDEHFESAQRAADRMEELISGLLTLARQGQAVGEMEAVSLEAVAREACESVEGPDATLTFDDPPTVRADRSRLRQLVENLLRNAVEHGSTGPRSQAHEDAVEHGSTGHRTASGDAVEHAGPEVTVTIGALDEEGFYVADDGPGIPEESHGEVFEFGYSGGDGTGFGLAIVKEIAEAHGWRVSLGDGPGARFEFRGVTLA
ncbi:PAS domain S-box protein [Natronomonas sp. EA1]|uniref:PAS domain S-box protein n=1 Tax=Natronomonas sp. EA1 TaxID=3421655 RepID=UPI003EBC7C56